MMRTRLLTADDITDSPKTYFRERSLTAVGIAAPTVLVVLGSTLLALSLSADFLGLSRPGIGEKQLIAITLSVALTVIGIAAQFAIGRIARAEIVKFLFLAAQVGLLAVALRMYDIENIGFSKYLTVLIFCGFITNHFLPANQRPTFFLLLSLAGLLGVMHLKNTLLIIAAGSALIIICHLKIALVARIAALLAAMAALAAYRADWLTSHWSSAMLPILASMFMFRLSIYLYDIENSKGPKSWSQRFAYFFMLPNAVFPFFPVVDYSSFGRTYYNEDALRIYGRGVSWMLRGFVHLLLYRVVSYYLIIDPASVSGPLELLYYIVTNFLLYLKVSGLFHLIIGTLLIFGFNLPETHTKFYFSCGFIDFWRRINIFWKDYMQKMVFTPSFVRLKRWGVEQNTAILASMLIVFFATWALHAYQWFWIRGTVHLSETDAFFWGFLAVLLIAQTLYEMRLSAAPKRAGPRRMPLDHRGMTILRTSATMLTIFLLWSLWTSTTFGEWFALLEAGGAPVLSDGATADELIVAAICTALAAFVLMLALGVTFGLGPHASEAPRSRLRKQTDERFIFSGAMRLGAIGVLCAIQAPSITAPMSSTLQQFAFDLATSKLNARDAATLERGYYEGLTDVNRFNMELWELYAQRPDGWVDIRKTEAARDTDNYLQYELRPSVSIIYKGTPFQTNRWGMRDKHYAMEKPENAYRFALIGDSRAMGYGVADPELFEGLLEERLNEEIESTFAEFEILNFGVADYKPIQRLIVLEEKALAFKPDAFIYIAHFDDFELRHLAEAVKRGVRIPYRELEEIVVKSGADRSMSMSEIRRRLDAYEDEAMEFVYDRMAAIERATNVPVIWIYLPSVKEYTAKETEQRLKLAAMAEKAGFISVDLSGMFDGEDLSALWVAEWDYHPNARCNRLIADRLFKKLTADPQVAELLKISRPTSDQAISQ